MHIEVTFEQPVLEVIRHRASWRTYDERPIEPATSDRLTEALAGIRSGPFGTALRLGLFETPPLEGRALRSYGTYGVITGARRYLVGAVTRGGWDLEDFGFAFELAVLKATDLGLGTCWLGGTLDRSLFGELLGLRPSERMPAVSPVGYATPRRSLRDRALRLGAGSASRHPWETLFFDGRFGQPLSLASAGPYAECLEMVRVGPSASNQQPWRVVRDSLEPVLHFYRHRSRTYAVPERLGLMKLDLQRADLGIAMCHFTLACQALGLEGHFEAWPTPPEVGPLPPRTRYVASFVPARR